MEEPKGKAQRVTRTKVSAKRLGFPIHRTLPRSFIPSSNLPQACPPPHPISTRPSHIPLHPSRRPQSQSPIIDRRTNPLLPKSRKTPTYLLLSSHPLIAQNQIPADDSRLHTTPIQPPSRSPARKTRRESSTKPLFGSHCIITHYELIPHPPKTSSTIHSNYNNETSYLWMWQSMDIQS